MTKQIPTMTVYFRDEGLDVQFKGVDKISPGMLGRVQIAARKKLREHKGKAFNAMRRDMGPQAHLLPVADGPLHGRPALSEEPEAEALQPLKEMTDDELIATLTEK